MGQGFSFRCASCGGGAFKISQLRASSGGFAAYMNWEDKLMTCVTCQKCRRVDLYDIHYTDFMGAHSLSDDLLE